MRGVRRQEIDTAPWQTIHRKATVGGVRVEYPGERVRRQGHGSGVTLAARRSAGHAMASSLTPLKSWSRAACNPRRPRDASAMLQSNHGAVPASQERDATLAMLPTGTLWADGAELGCGVGRVTVALAAQGEG